MSLLATAGEDVRIWKLPDINIQSVKNGTNSNVLHCSCSPNGQYVAYTYEEEGIRVASLFDDELPLVEIPTPCEQSSVSFNGNSRYIVSGGIDCVINIWDVKSRTAKRTYKDHFHAVTCCQFNYNDNFIASATDHGEILLLNVQKGDSFSLGGHDDPQAIRSLGYSYFSRSLLASVSDSGTVCLWDTKERKMLKKFQDHKAPSTCLAFSPLNDMLLCSCGLDKRIIFYDVTGKKTVKTINTEGPITSCDFFNDGCTVAAGSASGHIYLFDLRHGSVPVKVVSAHKTSVRSISFQKTPKESKSPKRPVEMKTDTLNRIERKSSSSEANDDSLQTKSLSSTNLPEANSQLIINRENDSTTLRNTSSERPPLSVKQRQQGESQTLVQPSMMGKRENSTMALNRLISFNQTPEQANSAIPPKAAKLMGDEIFSPIPIDNDFRSSTLPRKLKVGKQKSFAKVNTEVEEPERPSYVRSKSGLSRLSMLAKSTEDINSTVKKDKKDKDFDGSDSHDGKKSGGGLLGFKSPFKKSKKHNYNKHSDESETSSIDSLSLEDRASYLRGKKDRSSGRSSDSLGTNLSRKTSNSSNVIMHNINEPIDTDQLMLDIQNSLATQSTGELSKSPSMRSGDFATVSPGKAMHTDIYQDERVMAPSQIQVDFIQKMIDEAAEETRFFVHERMVSLQVEFIRQLEIQKEEVRQMLQQTSINGELLLEIDRLRKENENLKNIY